MTIQELHIKLKELEISEEKYYLHGVYGSTNDDDKLSLTIKKGKHLTKYEVYYKEKGEKHSVRTFTEEEDACQYIHKRLKENKEMENRYSK
ncbi:hypothetical protein WIW50_14810 [Flavobacteriaceae bacterium 3-367]|uniref:hypothetical protein n=1 Tax=Eudoraea algarum TaxID=3417568 RepID=UPI003278BF90